MKTHPGYFLDSHRGQRLYRCALCRFDSFDQTNARKHVQHNHRPILLPETDIGYGDWLNIHSKSRELEGMSITIGFLTWNTAEASRLAALQIAEEKDRLAIMGVRARIVWVDNGSDDGTVGKISPILSGVGNECILLGENEGQSRARNRIIRRLVGYGGDALMFVDGDIEVVPWSSFAMLRYLSSKPQTLCIGLNSQNCAPDYDGHISLECLKIEDWMTFDSPMIAWTQYGVFDAAMFGGDGLEFDESGPFGGPGWGMEDDDFYFQMLMRGYESRNCPYFRYLHRPRNSSLRNLGQSLATKVFKDRQEYMRDKWGECSHPVIQDRLARIKAMGLPSGSF